MPRFGRSCLSIIALCIALWAAPPVLAQPHAQVGYLHADGTVQIDLSRFTTTLAITETTTLPVADSQLYVSNGFLSLLRMGNDQCSSEQTRLYIYDTVEDTFEPIAMVIPNGPYGIGSQIGPTDSSGPIFAVDLAASISPYLMKCDDVGCDAETGGACFRMLEPDKNACACVWSITTPEGWPGLEHGFFGCRMVLDLRAFWELHHSIHSQFIQNP